MHAHQPFCPEEPIDREVLDQMTGGDVEFGREVVSTFVEDLRLRVPRLHRAVDEADVAAVVRESHSIKGAALSVGATPLARVALIIETKGLGGVLDGVMELTRLVADESRRVEQFAAGAFASD